jgi:hypothetical protein
VPRLEDRAEALHLGARALCGLAVGLVLGCGSHRDDSGYIPDALDTRIYDVTIDANVGIDVLPGEGAGVFIEYASGGDWYVFTTCDTELSSRLCDFDIFLSVALGESIERVEGVDLERYDHVVRVESGIVRALFVTDSDFDGVTFRTSPGATLRLDVLIDGIEDPEIIFWNGYGALQSVAPSNPLDLTPDRR